MNGPFFALAPYHILLVGCGLVIIAGYWLPRFLSGNEPAASGLLILGGLGVFGMLPGGPEVITPLDRPTIWELTSEFAVIIALFGTGIRIDRVTGGHLWDPTIRLLAIAMPLCIIGVAGLGVLAGMTLAGAILLGAVLAPTDPVLAADVQVGKPLEGGEHPIRFALTTEAGLNDGLAFPFLYLALFIAAASAGDWHWMGEWFGLYVVYKILVGTVAGAAAGRVLSWVLFNAPQSNPLAKTGSAVIALAGVLLTYGLTELVEGYGFIAAFVMGLVLRREEADHEFHGKMHSFTEALEHAVTAILLVALGGAIPALWPYLGWREAGIGLALIFVVRPAAGLISLHGTRLAMSERAIIAFYGVRGIGSVYYLAYAGGAMELVDQGRLWAVVAFTILLSTLIHGFSAAGVVGRATRRSEGQG